MRFLPSVLPASRVSMLQWLGRLHHRPTRTTMGRPFLPRLVVDHVWPHMSMGLLPHLRRTASAFAQTDVLSYVFFLLLVGITFLL
jgi:hypothetical protein